MYAPYVFAVNLHVISNLENEWDGIIFIPL
jgi:hypothetical protein